MNYKYNVSIIIVNYNGKRYLKNLFESLISMKKNDLKVEVVFVDNNSNDDSVAFINDNCWSNLIDVKIISSEKNLGFAGGNNLGVNSAEGEYIVLLNNDTSVDENWLLELYSFITSREDCVMAASKLLFFYDFIKIRTHTKDKMLLKSLIQINDRQYSIENKYCKNILYAEEITCFGHSEIAIPLLDGICDYSLKLTFSDNLEDDMVLICGTEYSPEQLEEGIIIPNSVIKEKACRLVQNAGSGINENYDGYDIGSGEEDSEEYNTMKELQAGCGASIMMRKQDFDDIGQFDDRLFMYYEDTDLSFRMRRTGKKILFCPTSIVRHIHTGSSGEWSPFFLYHVVRNKLIFIYKNISKGIFYRLFFRQILSAIKHRDRVRLFASIDAYKIIVLKYLSITYDSNKHLQKEL